MVCQKICSTSFESTTKFRITEGIFKHFQFNNSQLIEVEIIICSNENEILRDDVLD